MAKSEDDYAKVWARQGVESADIEQTRAAQQQPPQVAIQSFSGQAFFLGRVDAGDLPDLIARLRDKR